MSSLRLTSIESKQSNVAPLFKDSTGTEIGQLARAWIKFNGTGTPAAQSSFNCAFVTDHGTGEYTVGPLDAFPSDEMCVVCSAGNLSSAVASSIVSLYSISATAIRILIDNQDGTNVDRDIICLAVFGD